MSLALVPITLSLLSSTPVVDRTSPLLPVLDPSTSDTFVGYYAEEEPVANLTLFHIAASDVSFVQSTGRQVGYYWEHGIQQYYYFADENMPRITEVTAIYDNMESYIYMVEQLEDTSRELFFGLGEPTELNNYVLGYLRSFNGKYSGNAIDSEWRVAAGALPPAYWVEDMNAVSTRGLRFNEYFRRYVEKKVYNYALHEQSGFDIDEEGLVFGKYLKDPFFYETSPDDRDVAGTIDMPHLLAAADAYYDETGVNVFAMNCTHIYKFNTVDLGSWAGDLHTRVKEMKDDATKPVNPIPFDPGNLFVADGKFPESDLFADLDGCNMARMYLDNDYSVSEALRHYYDRSNILDSNLKYLRFDRFVTTALKYPDGYGNTGQAWSGTVKEQFYRELFYSLGIQINGFSNDGSVVCVEGPSRSTFFVDYYRYLGGISYVSYSDRLWAVEYFADYLYFNVNPVLQGVWSV